MSKNYIDICLNCHKEIKPKRKGHLFLMTHLFCFNKQKCKKEYDLKLREANKLFKLGKLKDLEPNITFMRISTCCSVCGNFFGKNGEYDIEQGKRFDFLCKTCEELESYSYGDYEQLMSS